MSRRPAFSFYPGDWRNNANLRRCSWGARGVWVEVMGLMHDADDYGVLRWPLKQIAHSIGAPPALVRELATFSVMKGCDSGECQEYIYTPRSGRKAGPPITLLATQPGPVWFSSRMLRDEHVRVSAGASTRFGTTPGDSASPPASPSRAPSRRQGDGSSSSSSSSITNHTQLPSPEPPGPASDLARWGSAVKAALREHWPDDSRVEMMPMGLCSQWLADGLSLEMDVLPTVRQLCADKRDGVAPSSLKYFNDAAKRRHAERLAAPPESNEMALRLKLWNDRGYWQDDWGARPSTRPIDKLPEAA